MHTYETDHASADRIQVVSKPKPIEGLIWYGRKAADIAEYLATVNLSGGKLQWDYPLQTLPRPSGEGTNATVTVFPIPRQPSVIHDLDVDSKGNVWYGNTGWDFIGKLNPRTGAFSEWPSPNFLPEPEEGLMRIVGVQDIQVDETDTVWVAVMGNKHASFSPETETWQTYDLPVIWKNPFLGPVRAGEDGLWATGITSPPDGPVRHEHAFRFDIKTGELGKGIMLFDDKPFPTDPNRVGQLNYCYMMDQDADGNFLCTAPEASSIARSDSEGNVRLVSTPTPNAYPRRGYRDDNNHFWFTEFFADNVASIDLATDKITEYPIQPRYISPYYARPDRSGKIWISSTGSDRLMRLDPETGEVVKYLMPVSYDARKVVIDNSADRITVWLPNKNHGQLIRIEVAD
jgi:streptogramin lyase